MIIRGFVVVFIFRSGFVVATRFFFFNRFAGMFLRNYVAVINTVDEAKMHKFMDSDCPCEDDKRENINQYVVNS